MKTTGKDNIRIFAEAEDDKDNNQLNEIIFLLKDYGIKYNEKKNKLISSEEFKNKRFELKMDCKVNKDVGRVLAKIAFNYFTYCALSDKTDVLYHSNFNRIKQFINDDKSIGLNDIMFPDNDCILFEEKISKKRVVGHIIAFECQNGNIIARVTIFGKMVYNINLGQIPEELFRDDFGCGHFFDPFSKSIINLTRNIDKIKSANSPLVFGLFKKY
jgi:hypothetical protein